METLNKKAIGRTWGTTQVTPSTKFATNLKTTSHSDHLGRAAITTTIISNSNDDDEYMN